MKSQAWLIRRSRSKPFRYEGYEKMLYDDTVYFDADMTAEEVKRSLINHDGYPDDIIVRKAK